MNNEDFVVVDDICEMTAENYEDHKNTKMTKTMPTKAHKKTPMTMKKLMKYSPLGGAAADDTGAVAVVAAAVFAAVQVLDVATIVYDDTEVVANIQVAEAG